MAGGVVILHSNIQGWSVATCVFSIWKPSSIFCFVLTVNAFYWWLSVHFKNPEEKKLDLEQQHVPLNVCRITHTFTHLLVQVNALYSQLTYDNLLHPIYPCSLRLHRTSSSCEHTPHSHTGTRPPDSEVSGAPSSGCSAPWTRLICPCSLGRHRNSTGQGCTRSHCNGTRAGRRWASSTSPRRWRPHSHRRHHRRRLAPHTSRYGTGNLWRGKPLHLCDKRGRWEEEVNILSSNVFLILLSLSVRCDLP